MGEFSAYDEFSEINAVGNPNKVMQIDNSDAKSYGPIGNCRPARVPAEGLSIETFPTLYADKATRKGMSTTKNESLHKSFSSRK